jgi:hypothetical protein
LPLSAAQVSVAMLVIASMVRGIRANS